MRFSLLISSYFRKKELCVPQLQRFLCAFFQSDRPFLFGLKSDFLKVLGLGPHYAGVLGPFKCFCFRASPFVFVFSFHQKLFCRTQSSVACLTLRDDNWVTGVTPSAADVTRLMHTQVAEIVPPPSHQKVCPCGLPRPKNGYAAKLSCLPVSLCLWLDGHSF